MRLLHVHELKVKEFNNDEDRPPYAILSHTWGKGEVSFQDIQTPKAALMAGYTKILKFCEIAKQDGFEYVWIDTCCIDKTSSSELSEAINSMYMWYRLASICYVFLSDVESKGGHHRRFSQFRTSRWFSRGWTLQELLAPEVLVFYNKAWVDIGTKGTMQKIISEITKIPCDALLDTEHIPKISIAARMSWAASRMTTRVEDKAYSLMGIFGVNMPPLYGEGEKAFTRLQLEIIKNSDDESILAWSWAPHYTWSPKFMNPGAEGLDMLAPSPDRFKYCHGVTSTSDRHQPRPPFSMSNKGLHIWLPGVYIRINEGDDLFLAKLNCVLADGRHIGIVLQSGSGKYIRTGGAFAVEAADLKTMGNPTELYIVPNPDNFTPAFRTRYHPRTRNTFDFIDNTSSETGYNCIFFYSGGEELSNIKPHRRRCVFSESAGQSIHKFHMMFLVVESIQDPAVCAVIVLGMVKTDHATVERHCRVFAGSRIPKLLSKAIYNNNFELDYYRIFSWNGFKENPSQSSELVYIPNEKIVKRLNDNSVLTITVRTGPTSTSLNEMYSVHSHQHRVLIAFSRPSLRDGKISDADTVSEHESRPIVDLLRSFGPMYFP